MCSEQLPIGWNGQPEGSTAYSNQYCQIDATDKNGDYDSWLQMFECVLRHHTISSNITRMRRYYQPWERLSQVNSKIRS